MKKQSISKVEQLNNLKQQVIALKVANKDKAETIKAIKQELLEYSQLRDRFKILYEENNKFKKAIKILKKIVSIPLEDDFAKVKIDKETKKETHYYALSIKYLIDEQEYELLKEVLENE